MLVWPSHLQFMATLLMSDLQNVLSSTVLSSSCNLKTGSFRRRIHLVFYPVFWLSSIFPSILSFPKNLAFSWGASRNSLGSRNNSFTLVATQRPNDFHACSLITEHREPVEEKGENWGWPMDWHLLAGILKGTIPYANIFPPAGRTCEEWSILEKNMIGWLGILTGRNPCYRSHLLLLPLLQQKCKF